MALWQLLMIICFAMAVGTASAAANVARTGFSGYVLATGTGMVVGASCSWMMWRMHKALMPELLHRLKEGNPLANWYGRAFYVSKGLWILFAGFLGFWLSSALLRMAHLHF